MKKGLSVFIVSFSLMLTTSFVQAADPCDLSVGGDAAFSFQSITPDNAPSIKQLGVDCSKLKISNDANINGKNLATTNAANATTILIKNIISIVTGFIASFAALYAIFRLMGHALALAQSQGDATKMDAAKKGIVNTLASLFIISIAYMIVYTIINTTLAIPATLPTSSTTAGTR